MKFSRSATTLAELEAFVALAKAMSIPDDATVKATIRMSGQVKELTIEQKDR